MSSLTAAQFGAFFRAAWGYEPFPWQQRLATQVASGRWPDALALPTASGKTACIDVAVFALALQANSPPERARTAPRRIFFVVDRRVIVDEAFLRARKLAQSLAGAQKGVLREIADRLRALGDSELPLATFQLRGGIYRDNAWARTPGQPTVIASTVDQLGSRLLFRAYGRSSRAWPVDAGLAGNDSLVILDEAHCANPFAQTLNAVARYRQWADDPVLQQQPFQVVVMSATPRAGTTDTLGATSEDRSHPVLGPRLKARKPASLIEVLVSKRDNRTTALADAISSQAQTLAAEGARAVGVIVNRVAGAKKVAERLRAAVRDTADVVLLIGRMRPIDRDHLMSTWRPTGVPDEAPGGLLTWLAASVDAARLQWPLPRPVFVVATQCLEVGANLDFDALVAECASLDALRQRFGRLNRLGQTARARGVIMVASTDATPKEPDPIYGTALADTWAWLLSQADARRGAAPEIDFGVTALETRLRAAAKDDSSLFDRLSAPAPDAPIMLPTHVDCWVQTAPVPVPSPDVEVFLHGPGRYSPEVSVCWRADLDPRRQDDGQWIAAIAACPPSASECMPVPLHIVGAWLSSARSVPADTIADVSGATPAEPEGIEDSTTGRAVVRWLGPDDSAVVRTRGEMRPGDTIVIPSTLGGAAEFGHVLPQAYSGAVSDLGDEANLAIRGRAVLRLHPALLAAWPKSPARSRLMDMVTAADLPERLGEPIWLQDLRSVLDTLADEGTTPPWLIEAARRLAGDRRLGRGVALHPCGWTDQDAMTGGGIVLRASKAQARPDAGETAAHEDDTASISVPVGLRTHLEGVANQARQFADICGLPLTLASDVELAAALHDCGKADPRFQALLRGGSTDGHGAQPLAKSGGAALFGRAYHEARLRARYPEGARHELLSVRLAENATALLTSAHDPDLVLHLIASHHGRCRPFAPTVLDDQPVSVTVAGPSGPLYASSATTLERLDSGVAQRFWRLVRRYGWWGLAWLEAVLILADHRRSETEEMEGS